MPRSVPVVPSSLQLPRSLLHSNSSVTIWFKWFNAMIFRLWLTSISFQILITLSIKFLLILMMFQLQRFIVLSKLLTH